MVKYMEKSNKQKLQGRFWLTNNGEYFAGHGRVNLLRNIKECGSISAAAKAMGMSYKAAWDSVDVMNRLAGEFLVKRTSGGRYGGGSILTDAGVRFIETYDNYNRMFNDILAFIEEHPEVDFMIDKIRFKSSADNTFYGKIKSIDDGAVMSIVTVDCGGIDITASLSKSSVSRMEIEEGGGVCALINSNQIILLDAENDVKSSARNIFEGSVNAVKRGAVNSEVYIDLNRNHKLCVQVTNESADTMSLSYGKKITAMCKASAVMLIC